MEVVAGAAHLIGGAWRPASTTRPVVNPATGDPVGWVGEGTPEDAREAVAAAAEALPLWAALPAQKRAVVLRRAGELLRERQEELAVLLTREQGKPLRDSRKELATTADVLDIYAEEARRLGGEVLPGETGETVSLVLRQPVGVVAAIGPWNFPVELLAWKIAPALAAGCTVVAKPPTEAPLTALQFADCLRQAGCPAGVLNMVTGPGPTVGEALVTDPRVRKVAFTGSTATGRRIAALAAPGLKRVTLELGGSAPFIVCADADLDRAVPDAIRRTFSHAGQICISVNRIYVDARVASEFIEAFRARTRRLVVADGLRVPDADMGPLINEPTRQHVRDHVGDALAKGARLLAGGREPEGTEYASGYFYLPTVLTNVDAAMRCMREETFGPLAPIAAFDRLEDALAQANASEYGLAAYLYTRDLRTALRAAEQLESGGVGINVNDVTDLRMPFGGWKASGIGRELGRYGLESYLELKHVRIRP
jgi:acyl-CoA reductase-like NAD-dependent aldehyde dehydrogenase